MAGGPEPVAQGRGGGDGLRPVRRLAERRLYARQLRQEGFPVGLHGLDEIEPRRQAAAAPRGAARQGEILGRIGNAEKGRLLAEQGMEILFVPFWTDTKNGAILQRDWNLIAKGTRMTQDFAEFLKKISRY